MHQMLPNRRPIIAQLGDLVDMLHLPGAGLVIVVLEGLAVDEGEEFLRVVERAVLVQPARGERVELAAARSGLCRRLAAAADRARGFGQRVQVLAERLDRDCGGDAED